VFENGILRRMSVRKMDEVAGGWRGLHNEEFHSFYSSSSIIRMTNSRKTRWAGMQHEWEKREMYRILAR
jgi:hypothetical protein